MPNGSAKVRNWIVSVAAVLGVLGAVFYWCSNMSERLARVEVLLEVIRVDIQDLRSERANQGFGD